MASGGYRFQLRSGSGQAYMDRVPNLNFVPPFWRDNGKYDIFQYFWMFLLFRGIVGIGEASYSNVCPSMISDMFTGPARSRMYMLFYFAVPVGRYHSLCQNYLSHSPAYRPRDAAHICIVKYFQLMGRVSSNFNRRNNMTSPL